jgi:peroxiredoxin
MSKSVSPVVRSGGSVILGLALHVLLIMAIPSLAPAAAGKVGDEAPVLAQTDLAGQMQNMGDVLGKNVILMEYWSIYCVSCVQEMPYLVEIFSKYVDPRFKDKGVIAYPTDYKGLAAYSIDLDSFSPKRVQKFIDGLKFKIPYPVIVDANRDIANAFKVGMLPTTIVIGKDKKIKMYHIGFKPGDEKDIEEIIKTEMAK